MTDTKPPEQSNDVEKHIDHAAPAKEHADSHVHKEAEKGKPELVKAQKQHDQHLKAGGKSGISDMFGSAMAIWGVAMDGLAKGLDEQAQKQAASGHKDSPSDKHSPAPHEGKTQPAQEKEISQAKVTTVAGELLALTTVNKDANQVVKLLQNSSQAEIEAYKTLYKNFTGADLAQQLAGAYDGTDLKRIQFFLNRKDGDSVHIPAGLDRDALLKADIEIQGIANRGRVYDPEAVNKLLAGKSPEELKAMDSLYKERYGLSLNDQFMSLTPPMSFDVRIRLANDWKSEQEQSRKNDEIAKILTVAVTGRGKDEIAPLLAGKTEAELKEMDTRFHNSTGKTLEEFLKGQFEGSEQRSILELLHHKDSTLSKLPDGVDRAKLREANEAIYNAEKVPPMNTVMLDSYTRILAGKTPAEIEAMKTLFKERYGEDLNKHVLDNSMIGLDQLVNLANAEKTKEAALKADSDKVDRRPIEKLAEQLHQTKDAQVPVRYEGLQPIIGWPPGEHPAEKLVEHLSAAELKSLNAAYKEKYGHDIKEDFAADKAVAERLERTINRDYKGALDKLSPAERADARARAETLYRAMLPHEQPGGDNKKDDFFAAIEKQPPEKRAAIEQAFHELSGEQLEEWIKDKFSGYKQEKALNYLRYGDQDEAAKIHLALADKDPSTARQIISMMDSKNIAKLDALYQQHYHTNLHDAFAGDDNLSDADKKALQIYGQGTDYLKAHPEEWTKLMEISLGDYQNQSPLALMNGQHTGDIEMFKEIMSSAPPEMRVAFIADGGLDKVNKAFGPVSKDAMEYLAHGNLSLEQQIKKNIGVWSDDHDAIFKAADDNKDDQDHQDYRAGAAVFQKFYGRLDEAQKVAFNYQAKMNDSSIPNLPNTSDMSEEEKRVYDKFQSINAALNRGLYNENGKKFRDHIISPGGVEGALEQVQKMSWDEVQKLKTGMDKNPLQLRLNIQDFMLRNKYDLMSEDAQQQIREALARRLSAEKPEDLKYADGQSFEEATKVEQKSISPTVLLNPVKGMNDVFFDSVSDAVSGLSAGSSENKVLNAISHMSLEDQQKYRSDSDFRDRVQSAVAMMRNESFKTVAQHMLQNLMDPKVGTPQADWIDGINIEAGKKETDEPQVIRFVEAEFKKDPGLHERIAHPKTYEDIMLKGRLDQALHNALDDDEYERWAKPVLENGRLSIEEKLDIDKQKGDQKSVFTDIRNLSTAQDAASAAERKLIVTDEYYRDRVLRDLSPEQRELAESILKHPDGMAPEDVVRSYVLDTGVSKQDMLASLRELKGKDIIDLHEQYALKYHQDLNQVLSDKLSGDDKKNALNYVRLDAATARQTAEDAYEEVSKSNNGFGASFTKWWGSGAGDLAADKLLQLQAKIQAESAKGNELSVDEAKEFAKDAREYTRMFEKAKEKSAEEFANAALTAASFVVPGGLEIKMLVFATAGGLAKAGIKEAIAGDASARDFVSGFITTGLAAIGPGEMAGALGLGEKIAVQTGERVAARGGSLLAEGAEKRISDDLSKAAANAFAHGDGVIKNEVLDKIVSATIKAGATDAEKAALRKMVVEEFQTAVKQEVKQGITNYVVREGLSTGAGYVGGFAGGATEAAMQWDSSKSFAENMSQILDAGSDAGKAGAMGAFVIGNALKLGGKGLHYLRKGVEAPAPEVGAPIRVASEGDYSIVRPENAPPPAGKSLETDPRNFARVGNSEYYVGSDGQVYKFAGENADGKVKLLPDQQARIAVSDEALVKGRGPGDTRTADAKPPTDASSNASVATRQDSQAPQTREQPANTHPAETSQPVRELQRSQADSPQSTRSGDAVARRRASDTLHGPGAGDTLHDMKAQVEELNLPPGVKRALDQASVPPEERAQLLDWIGKNKLAAPEVIDQYLQKFHEKTSAWHDASAIAANADAAGAQLRSAYDEYRTRLTDRLRADNTAEEDIQKLLLHPQDLRNRYSSEAELVQTIDKFKDVQEMNAQAQTQLHDLVTARTADLQNVLDKLADEQGIPRIKLDVVRDEFMGPASGLYRDGTIKLRQSDVLKISDPASLMETTYHEFVHNQQDSLVMRSVIDDVEKQSGRRLQFQDIDRLKQLQKQLADTHVLPSDQLNELMRIKKQLDQVRADYKSKSGWNISDDHLKEVIRARNDRVLSVEERARADQLAHAFKNMANPGEAFVRAGNDMAVTVNELQKLQQPGGAEDLVRRLSEDDSVLSRHLFDSPIPPPEVEELIEEYVRNGRLTNSEASTRLQQLLERQHRVLDDYRKAIYREYVAGFHEQEAWIIGETVDHTARERGMGPSTPQYTAYSGDLPPATPAEAAAASKSPDPPKS